MSLEEVKSAAASLSRDERAELKIWLDTLHDDAWDAKMRADAQQGKLSDLIAKARREHREGTTTPLP
jgi:hypothetical protein